MTLDSTHSEIPGSPPQPIEIPTPHDPIPSPSPAPEDPQPSGPVSPANPDKAIEPIAS
jgi:hypothetical protein